MNDQVKLKKRSDSTCRWIKAVILSWLFHLDVMYDIGLIRLRLDTSFYQMEDMTELGAVIRCICFPILSNLILPFVICIWGRKIDSNLRKDACSDRSMVAGGSMFQYSWNQAGKKALRTNNQRGYFHTFVAVLLWVFCILDFDSSFRIELSEPSYIGAFAQMGAIAFTIPLFAILYDSKRELRYLAIAILLHLLFVVFAPTVWDAQTLSSYHITIGYNLYHQLSPAVLVWASCSIYQLQNAPWRGQL